MAAMGEDEWPEGGGPIPEFYKAETEEKGMELG
jgi:hypothetical protein